MPSNFEADLADIDNIKAVPTILEVAASTHQGPFELSVSNQSEPIPPATLERLFQPFFRVGAKPVQQGLGLGLYIADEIARAHNGKLDVRSTPEETRFTFRMSVA